MYRVIIAANDYSLPWNDKIKWCMDTLGYSEDEARDVIYSLEHYTNMGYHTIHTQDFENDYMNTNRDAARDIEKLLNHPKMPKYHGTLYRGLVWRSYESGDIEDILNQGIWLEPGITSFSTDKDEILKFAEGGTGSEQVYITLKNSRTGCEIGFLSGGGGEGEVLIPASVATKGFKIIDWSRTSKSYDRINKKTGAFIKTIEYDVKYFITCTE